MPGSCYNKQGRSADHPPAPRLPATPHRGPHPLSLSVKSPAARKRQKRVIHLFPGHTNPQLQLILGGCPVRRCALPSGDNRNTCLGVEASQCVTAQGEPIRSNSAFQRTGAGQREGLCCLKKAPQGGIRLECPPPWHTPAPATHTCKKRQGASQHGGWSAGSPRLSLQGQPAEHWAFPEREGNMPCGSRGSIPFRNRTLAVT